MSGLFSSVTILLLCIREGGVYAQACGGTIRGQGYLTSPNYPANYQSSANCSWTLYATQGMTIQLEFLSLTTESCCDYVTIYDGMVPSVDRSAVYTYRFSGSTTPSTRILTSYATVVFTSDSSVQMSGFNALLTSVNSLLASAVALPSVACTAQGNYWCSQSLQCVNSWRRCNSVSECQPYREDELACVITTVATTAPNTRGGTIRGQGYLASPNYPANYPISAYCSWTLYATEGMAIQLQFVFLTTESCCDYVTIYDGMVPALDRSTVYTDRFSGSTTPSTVILTSYATVVFTSDSSVQMRGFNALFTSVNSLLASAVPLPSVACTVQDNYWCSQSLQCVNSWSRCNSVSECQPYGEDELACVIMATLPSAGSLSTDTTGSLSTAATAGIYTSVGLVILLIIILSVLYRRYKLAAAARAQYPTQGNGPSAGGRTIHVLPTIAGINNAVYPIEPPPPQIQPPPLPMFDVTPVPANGYENFAYSPPPAYDVATNMAVPVHELQPDYKTTRMTTTSH